MIEKVFIVDKDGPINGVGELHTVSPPPLFNQYFSLDTQVGPEHENMCLTVNCVGSIRSSSIKKSYWKERIREN